MTAPKSDSKSGIYAILGNGALGLGLAHLLQRRSLPVAVFGRKGSVAHESELDFAGVNFKFKVPALQAKDLKKIEVVFVAVKAHQFQAALEQHLPLLPKKAVIIPVGNGAIDGELREIGHHFPDRRFRLGTSTLAVTRLPENRLSVRTREPKISWGPFHPCQDEPTDAEKKLLEPEPTFFEWQKDPMPNFRQKWLFNTTLNSIVGADRYARNGDVLGQPQRLMMVFSEAVALGEEHWGPWEVEPDELFSRFLRLVEKTADNQNSIVSDVKAGRETETDYLAGLARPFKGFPNLKQLDQKLRTPLH